MISKRVNPFLFIIPDFFLLYLGLFLTIRLRYDQIDQVSLITHTRLFTIVYLVWLVVFFIYRLFDKETLRRYSTLISNLAYAMTVNFLISALFFYYQPDLFLTPRRFLIVNAIISFLLVLAWHLTLKLFFQFKLKENVYYYLNPQEEQELIKEVNSHSYLGFRIQNFSENQLPSRGLVVISDEIKMKPNILNSFFDLRYHGLQFINFTDFYELLTRKVYLGSTNEFWFLTNINYFEKRLYNLIKKLIDISVAIILSPIFLITLAIFGPSIRYSTGGSIFFTQPRIGKNGKYFSIIKFRTMRIDTPNNSWTSDNDQRVTKLGKYLRRLHLDELPQVINLFKGDMSLVGPRPEQVHIVNEMKKQIPFFEERHLVKPGITGWSQLNIYAGSLEQTKLKLQYDLYYIKNRSLLMDFEIILKTIHEALRGKGR